MKAGLGSGSKTDNRGEGVNVVYDSVGKTTFLKGLDCLKPRGMMIHFGVSSGQIEPLNTRTLTERGSLSVTQPPLLTHLSSPEESAWRPRDIFRWIGEGDFPSSEWSTNIRSPRRRAGPPR